MTTIWICDLNGKGVSVSMWEGGGGGVGGGRGGGWGRRGESRQSYLGYACVPSHLVHQSSKLLCF